MKKSFLLSAFIGLSLTANAQLKVDSLGKVYVQANGSVDNASLSVGVTTRKILL